jgi:hypothetical protein
MFEVAILRTCSVIGASRLGGRMAELLERAGPKPLPDVQGRPEKLGFWVACVLPLPGEKQQEVGCVLSK